jgi:hypothetical protein
MIQRKEIYNVYWVRGCPRFDKPITYRDCEYRCRLGFRGRVRGEILCAFMGREPTADIKIRGDK